MEEAALLQFLEDPPKMLTSAQTLFLTRSFLQKVMALPEGSPKNGFPILILLEHCLEAHKIEQCLQSKGLMKIFFGDEKEGDPKPLFDFLHFKTKETAFLTC